MKLIHKNENLWQLTLLKLQITRLYPFIAPREGCMGLISPPSLPQILYCRWQEVQKNFFPVSDELQTICANNFFVTSAVRQTNVTVNTEVDKECSLIKFSEIQLVNLHFASWNRATFSITLHVHTVNKLRSIKLHFSGTFRIERKIVNVDAEKVITLY